MPFFSNTPAGNNTVSTPAATMHAYLLAKDGNRPHLLTQAFTADATLTMQVNTGTISFPPASQGRAAIADVLVSRFAKTYENVYTFCVTQAPADEVDSFRCDWLVAMTEKDNQAVRVGCGRYDWRFAPETKLAESLTITIEAMLVLAPAHGDAVLDWAANLPYPWCSRQQALHNSPLLLELQPVLNYLGRNDIDN